MFGLALVSDITADRFDHALGVLELVDGVLQLAIQYRAIGDHYYRVEQTLPSIIIQRGQLMGRPSNGIGLARAGAVLD
ncbi:hypothetical protein D3C84_426530 [compost metagenome]